MHRLAICFSGLALLLVSCSPKPVFRMTPQAKNTSFNQGTEYVQRYENGITLTISYYQHLSDCFVMDVEIVNESDSVLRVDPTQFSYDAYEYYRGPVPDSTAEIIASRKAVNPEQELLKTDMAISRKTADQKNATLLFAVGQAASIGASIAADTEKEREELEEDRDESYVHYIINQRQRELEKQGLRDQREVWEIDALRKTDLYPDEYIRGYVFFKNEPDAKGYMIRFDSEKAAFNVFYRQKKYEVE